MANERPSQIPLNQILEELGADTVLDLEKNSNRGWDPDKVAQETYARDAQDYGDIWLGVNPSDFEHGSKKTETSPSI